MNKRRRKKQRKADWKKKDNIRVINGNFYILFIEYNTIEYLLVNKGIVTPEEIDDAREKMEKKYNYGRI